MFTIFDFDLIFHFDDFFAESLFHFVDALFKPASFIGGVRVRLCNFDIVISDGFDNFGKNFERSFLLKGRVANYVFL